MTTATACSEAAGTGEPPVLLMSLEHALIPEFDENGYLPPGIHPATMAEIEARFGSSSEIRRVQMESLRWLMDLVFRASVSRVILNGSWVTSDPDPADIDCVILAGPEWGSNPEVEDEIADGLPYLTPQVGGRHAFEGYVTEVFASDRKQRPKGMVEVRQ